MPLIACPDCHREISDAAPACPHCGRPNTPASELEDGVYTRPAAKGHEAVRCAKCAQPLDYENVWRGGEVFCPCGAKYRFTAPAQPAYSPGVAAVLSLVIPGAGQMYRGNVGAGVAWLAAVVVGYMLLVLPGVILHLVCIFNAASARR